MTPPRFLFCAALLASAACQSPAEHEAAADRAVYALVEARRASLVGEATPFDIAPAPDSLRQRILGGEQVGVDSLGLVECLEIAAENSREVYTRRESLYLAALDLTLERWRLGWIPGLAGQAGADGTVTDAGEASGSLSPSLSRLLGTGAQIVASIGLTERACKEQNVAHRIGKFPLQASGKAQAVGETDGFVKLITDDKHGEILGAHMIGENVTELIAEICLGKRLEATAEEIIATVHAHPTISESIHEAALGTEGRTLHF